MGKSKATMIKEGTERPTLHLANFSVLPSSISHDHMTPSQKPQDYQKHNLGFVSLDIPLVSCITFVKK